MFKEFDIIGFKLSKTHKRRKQIMTKSIQAQAAQMIRKELKKHGIKAKVSSKSASMMTAVDITVYNQTPATMKKIKEFAGQFEYGSFNGMEDIYEYNNSRDDLPQVKYVQVQNEIDESIKEAARQEILETIETERFSSWDIQNLVYRKLQEDSFWTKFKPRQKVAA